MSRKAFTLMELLVVVAIMGLLGTVSVGGYRAMQRGMEERGVMQNVNAFMNAAYQRAQIDRVPVAIYFWNETLRAENEAENTTQITVGRAVAVRRAGRITKVDGNRLVDEFGDLRYRRQALDEDMEEFDDDNSSDDGIYLYKIGGAGDGVTDSRCTVRQGTVPFDITEASSFSDASLPIDAYAYEIVPSGGGVTWHVGDGYGFEFAELQLPKNFIFGSNDPKTSTDDPVQSLTPSFFTPTGTGNVQLTMTVSCLRPGASGDIEVKKVGESTDPTTRY